MSYSAVDVARKLLSIAQGSEDPDVTPMQLLKLVYLAHGWSLGIRGRPMVNEPVEAWRYGPVIRALYDEVKRFRDQPVSSLGSSSADFEKEDVRLLEAIYRTYGKWDGISLSNLTHRAGSPWRKAWNLNRKNARISNDLIENHYRSLYLARRAALGGKKGSAVDAKAQGHGENPDRPAELTG